MKQYACSASSPLVIQYSNLVKVVSPVEVTKLGCRSASIEWSLDDTVDRTVEPDFLSVLYWKDTEGEASPIKQTVRGKDNVSLWYFSLFTAHHCSLEWLFT